MQTTSMLFRQIAAGYVRPISWGVRASFDKTFDDSITFFTLDTSILDGDDVLAPTGDNPIQVWDQYKYEDYSRRTLSIEVTREETEPYSVTQAYADITLNNYDNYFTPNSGSPIQNYILPRRPFRAFLGFNGEVLPQIVGLSEGMPSIDKVSKTAEFHVVDFMSYLLDQDISETIILQNVTTGEVLEYLFDFMGLNEDQYFLDYSLNRLNFFYVEKGTKFGYVANKLIEAEIGRLYMDESGIIRFKNRYNYDLNPVYTFDKRNVVDYQVSDITKVINSVKITVAPRIVQSLQSIYISSTPILVEVGATIEVWATFNDPVTTVNAPDLSDTELTDSYYIGSLDEFGDMPYSDIGLDSIEVFSKAAKLTFTNTGSNAAYISELELYGTPAKIVDSKLIEEKDQDSIDKFEEQVYEISDNEYIQDESNAQSRAEILLHDYAAYGSEIELEVKGSPALQLGDAINLDLDGYQGIHIIMKTINIVSSDDGKLTQRLRARRKEVPSFFILDQSVLDGPDLLAP